MPRFIRGLVRQSQDKLAEANFNKNPRVAKKSFASFVPNAATIGRQGAHNSKLARLGQCSKEIRRQGNR